MPRMLGWFSAVSLLVGLALASPTLGAGPPDENVPPPPATAAQPAENPATAAKAADQTPDAPVGDTPAPAAPPAKTAALPAEPGAAGPEPKMPAVETPAAEKPEQKPAAEEPADKPAKPEPPGRPPLSKELEALRDRVRPTLAAYAGQPLNTRDFTSGDVLSSCLAFGCRTLVYDVGSQRNLSALGCLAWNYPCAGYRLLTTSEEGFLARVGYGLQEQPGQLLAVLAMSRVPPTYKIRVGSYEATVASLADYEKLECSARQSSPMRLVGLSYYATDNQSWKNRRGQEWSLAKLVAEETNRSTDLATSDAVDRLLALSYAVEQRTCRKEPLDGPWDTAARYVGQYADHVLSFQNADGTWHPRFFSVRGNSRDAQATLNATGRILEWLLVALPDNRLEEPGVVRAVSHVAAGLGVQPPRWGYASYTPQQIAAWMHALHALSLYDQRVFQPRDTVKKPKEPSADKSAKQAEGNRAAAK